MVTIYKQKPNTEILNLRHSLLDMGVKERDVVSKPNTPHVPQEPALDVAEVIRINAVQRLAACIPTEVIDGRKTTIA